MRHQWNDSKLLLTKHELFIGSDNPNFHLSILPDFYLHHNHFMVMVAIVYVVDYMFDDKDSVNRKCMPKMRGSAYFTAICRQLVIFKHKMTNDFAAVRDHFLALDKGDTHVLGRALQMLHKTRKAMTPEVC